MKIQKIPVFLLTGFLGSGKTTLLKAWLQSELLKDAALIINELGEVGLDNQLLANASESAALVPNACVCCTGLPALNQALEDLFWARLERRIPRFPNLVIETTGLASPGPILASFEDSELVKERYECMGTITCLSATTAMQVLQTHPEAKAQLRAANVCIITKTDLVSAEELEILRLNLEELFSEFGQHTAILMSGQANLPPQVVFKALHQVHDYQLCHPHGDDACGHTGHDLHHDDHHHHHDHDHDHDHPAHQARAFFWPISEQSDHEALLSDIRSLKALLGPSLLRLKGRVSNHQGQWLMQMAPFEQALSVEVDPIHPIHSINRIDEGKEAHPAAPKGLTLIVTWPLSEEQKEALLSKAQLQT